MMSDPPAGANTEKRQVLLPRLVTLTVRSGVDIKRLLPHRDVRTIGAWCFLDYYGPTQQADAMSVAAHPHTGLQTVSWLFSGEIEHRDSLGNIRNIHPGEMNLMTAGFGIAHSELSVQKSADLHGVQLWVALPNSVREMAPAFDHHGDLPVFQSGDLEVRLFAGQWLGHDAQVRIFSPLIGAEISARLDTETSLPLDAGFEYGILSVGGKVCVDGVEVAVGNLLYLPTGSSELSIKVHADSRFIVIGGTPFQESLLMWWNFIGRSHEEIVAMREAWESGAERFAPFLDQIGGRIPAPAMPNLRLTPRGPGRGKSGNSDH